MTKKRSIGVWLAAAVVCMSGVSAWGEVVSVDLQIEHSDGIATYWLSQDLFSTNFFTATGDASVNLNLQFNVDDYGPIKLTNASITDSSVAISDFDFGIDVGDDPHVMWYLNTHDIAGHVFGETALLYGRGGIEGTPPLPEIRYFRAANALGILLDQGGYVSHDSTSEWFTYGEFTPESPLGAMMTGGEGRIDVALASVADGMATYNVDAKVPIAFRIWTGIFDYISVGGHVDAAGTFTRPVGTPEPLLENGDFSSGTDGWDVSQGGAVASYDWNGNDVAQLITSSPVAISQLIDTPDTDYLLRFDYLFEQEDGTLDVTLDGQTLATITSEGIIGEFRTYSIPIDNPSLLGLTDADLQFLFDGPEGGLALMLDSVGAPVPTPEPSTFALLAVGAVGLFLCMRRTRRPTSG